MEQKQDISKEQNRADGNRAVMGRPVIPLEEAKEVIEDWIIDADHGVTYNDGALRELLLRLDALACP
jgi:hypothetical protein